MSSLFGIAANGASEFYTTKIDQSLRFDGNAKLIRTPSSTGNQKKWTTSFWLKRAKVGALQYLWSGASIVGNDGIAAIYINSDDKIHTYFDTSGANPYGPVNNRVYRDVSNWYHFVWAVDAVNTIQRIWINGVEETLSSSLNPPNFAYGMNRAGTDQGFGVATWGGSPNLDGYLANIVHLDGQYLDESYFGETKNGVWVPKEITGLTFGTNGFHLDFANSGSVGNDISGNNNDYTPTGFASTDVVPDSPTNNFCTINSIRESLVYNGSVTFSEGNLQSVDAGTTYSLHWTGTFGMSTGKWYWEVLAHTMGGTHSNIGICNIVHRVSTAGTGVFYGGDGKRNAVTYFTGTTNYGASYTSGDIIGVAFDADNETVTFYKNNSSQGAVGSVLVQSSGPYFAAAGDGQNSTTYKYVVNFGQDSSFAGNKTAQGNKDGNGNGDFYYTPPSGYLALCSANLPDTDLSPNQLEQADDYFNTVLYSGDGNTTQNVTGVGFQPDWTWLKERSSTSGHVMADTNRGYDKFLVPNDSVVEGTGILNSVLSDGFQTTNSGASNQSGQTYVSWNWKVNGGTTSTDNNGSLTSTVQTDSKVGISIATFTVPTQANFSFGHGLGSVPEMFWWKSRTSTQNWIVYHFAKTPSVPNQNGLYLNSSLAGFTSGGNWITELSSTRIAITDGQVSSGSNRDDVVYSFKSVEGFSKIDSYVGNGSSNGTFVYTGFRPAWVIIKSTSGGRHWVIKDAVRNTYNVLNRTLLANSNTSEDTTSSYDIDFLSNGFKCRTSSAHTNTNGETHVYMAFAEQPFKFSNAR